MHEHTEKAIRCIRERVPAKHVTLLPPQGVETDKRKGDRLLAYMQHKDGNSISQIAKSLCRSTSAISEWLNRAQDEGLRARHERPGRGRKHKMSESQMGHLCADLKSGSEACGLEQPVGLAPDEAAHQKKVRRAIQQERHAAAGAQAWIRLKSRPKNPKSASKRRQNEFKEAAQKMIQEKAAEGYTVLAEDGSAIQKTSNSPKHGWIRRDRSLTTPLSLSRQRRYMFGVLSAAQFYFMHYDKTSICSFCDFLERVHERFGKVLIFVGNASYHKSAGVKKTLEKYDGEIILEYTLPYTPELNPVEIRYRETRRRLSARVFDTLDDMEESYNIRSFLY